jgi:malate dehydrogenase
MQIGIIGSGNVGITSAFAIAEKGSGHVLLYDRTDGKAQGKALDLAEAGPIRRYDRRIRGTSDLDDLMEADVLVLAAGRPREAGMSRYDLFDDNNCYVQEVADRFRERYKNLEPEEAAAFAAGYEAPKPPVVIVLTEPVDVMTLAFQRYTGWPRERVMGVGTLLDATRLRGFVARELRLSAHDVDAMVVGTHGERSVILERYCRVSGLPLERFLPRERIDALVDRTRSAGDEVVEQAKRGSSFYTPGAAVGALVQAVVSDAGRVLPVSVALDGEYGARGVAASVPARVGRGGVEEIYQLELSDEEKAAFAASIAFQKPHADRVLEGGCHA